MSKVLQKKVDRIVYQNTNFKDIDDLAVDDILGQFKVVKIKKIRKRESSSLIPYIYYLRNGDVKVKVKEMYRGYDRVNHRKFSYSKAVTLDQLQSILEFADIVDFKNRYPSLEKHQQLQRDIKSYERELENRNKTISEGRETRSELEEKLRFSQKETQNARQQNRTDKEAHEKEIEYFRDQIRILEEQIRILSANQRGKEEMLDV